MAESEKPSLGRRIWAVFSAISTLQTIRDIGGWLFAAGTGTAAVAKGTSHGKFSELNVHEMFTGVSVFCFTALVALGIWHWAWRVAPSLAKWWRAKFSRAPFLTVTPRGGRIAVLEIENSGGKGSLIAWGRIVSVSGGWESKRRDSFPMLWRPHWEEAFIQAPHGAVTRPNSPPLVLWVAGHELVKTGTLRVPETVLVIFGGPGKVDAIHISPQHGSPMVTIEITIVSDPPLVSPCVRTYTAEIKGQYKSSVELVETTQ